MIWCPCRTGGLSLVVALVGSLVAGCGDGPACDYALCGIDEASCIERVAEAVGCHLGQDILHPEVRFISTEQYLEEREAEATPPTAEQQRARDDSLRALALIGLMPEGYSPARVDADSLRNFAAFYVPAQKSIVMFTDRSQGDLEGDYLLLVHEMVHAYQDSAWDLTALGEEHATTYDRFLGLRAWVEGYAVHFQNLASLELEEVLPEKIDWSGYYTEWQADSLQRAAASETPALDVTGIFPYSFGGEFAFSAWHFGGAPKLEEVRQRPPDSTRQVIGGFYSWPASFANGDVALDPAAVAVLPSQYTLLSGGYEGVWLLNAMLQRTAVARLWAPELELVSADYLAVWRRDDGQLAVMWRIRSSWADGLRDEMTLPGSRWMSDEQDAPTTYLITSVGPDLLLIAVDSGDARDVLADITGWQSPVEAAMVEESAAHHAGRIDAHHLGCAPPRR